MVRSPRPKPTKSPRSARGAFYLPWRELLDVLALGTWSMMLFRYWFGGKLLLLLHPDYAWLSNTAAVVLAATSLDKRFNLIKDQIKPSRARQKTAAQTQKAVDDSHVTLLPRNLS
ncbi:MAG: hypothetical protein WA901_11795, partial [Phormidesmis sp.]